MRIRYTGPHAAVEIAEVGETVARGETVDVPAGLGRRLLKGDFAEVGGSTRKRSAKTATEEKD